MNITRLSMPPARASASVRGYSRVPRSMSRSRDRARRPLVRRSPMTLESTVSAGATAAADRPSDMPDRWHEITEHRNFSAGALADGPILGILTATRHRVAILRRRVHTKGAVGHFGPPARSMPTLPEDSIRQVRERVDIVELIGRHVALRRSGRHYKALCPFHDEKTPSFYVDPARHSFKCFGCGEWGDAITFVQKIEGKGFVEAVRTLAAHAGVRLPDQSDADVAQAVDEQAQRDLAFRLTAHAAGYYREILLNRPEGQAGRDYQAQRKIPDELAERFQLGYAPAPAETGWDGLARELSRAKLPLDIAQQLGLVVESERTGRYFDRFRGRLIFPVVAPGGTILGFSGRVLPAFAEPAEEAKPPKYLNSPESSLYRKSDTLFGLDVASRSIRKKNRAVLVEGNVDVITMHRLGLTETVAPLGTALTANQCKLLRRFTRAVVLCFDADPAGLKAARDAIGMLLRAELEPRVVVLPAGQDPDSADPERLANLLESPKPAFTWLVAQLVRDGATESIEAQSRAVRTIVPLLRLFAGRDVRGEYALQAANLLKVPARRIWAALEGKTGPRTPVSNKSVPNSAPMRPAPPLPRGQAVLTSLLVDCPEAATRAKDAGVLDHVSDSRLQPILNRVIEAALAGDPQPGSGELLEFVDPSCRRQVYGRVFAGNYADVEDAQSIIDEGIRLCRREQLDREIDELDRRSAQARDSGDLDQLRELQTRRLELRKRQALLQAGSASS
ncbi:MAG: DNA primase [Myxococcales bacterium FL481]|nr:MAG: DNA primase [Myxococcales bacterium FL481]